MNRNFLEYSDARWLRRFLQLKDYQKKYGHCNVPARWEENPSLARWVDWQRRRHIVHGTQPEDRQEHLNSIGFVWEIMENIPEKKEWTARFKELQAFKKRFGHCRVPRAT